MSNLSIGLLNQLANALEAVGYSPGDITKLHSRPPLLERVMEVLTGFAEIVAVEHVINLDEYPFVPDGCKVTEHIKGGEFEWDPTKVTLWWSEKQTKGNAIQQGHELLAELKLKGESVLNACVLDHLLAHPLLILEEWREWLIIFWGTIYCDSDGHLFVRCLGGRDGDYREYHHGLDQTFNRTLPAIVLTS